MNSPEFYASLARSGVSKSQAAKSLGISVTSLRRKAMGQTEFRGSEIKTLSLMLGLSLSEVNAIFFDSAVN